jgi:hypothetical protein
MPKLLKRNLPLSLTHVHVHFSSLPMLQCSSAFIILSTDVTAPPASAWKEGELRLKGQKKRPGATATAKMNENGAMREGRGHYLAARVSTSRPYTHVRAIVWQKKKQIVKISPVVLRVQVWAWSVGDKEEIWGERGNRRRVG